MNLGLTTECRFDTLVLGSYNRHHDFGKSKGLKRVHSLSNIIRLVNIAWGILIFCSMDRLGQALC